MLEFDVHIGSSIMLKLRVQNSSSVMLAAHGGQSKLCMVKYLNNLPGCFHVL